jgi:folate-binding protein YgfZ
MTAATATTATTLHVDQSSWGVIRATGADRVRFLQGMCTSNIEALPPGGWVRTSMLDVKGRVTSVFEVLRADDHLLLVCEPGLVDKTVALLDRHAIMDDVAFAAERRPMHRIWGPPAEVWDARPVFAPCPPPVASDEEVEARRIEAGLPRYGIDVTEENFPFESRLREQIDYAKGCYLGQEPVARVHARGQASRGLMGLRLDGEGSAARGAQLTHPDRDRAGTVTSSAVSPLYGPIALAYVHRTVSEPGTELAVDGRRATVVELPFR